MVINYIKKRIVILICLIFIFQIVIPSVSSDFKITNKNTKNINLNNFENILYVGGSGPNNYSSIQEAVNAAQNEDTIFVYSKIYYEHILINKEIKLLGEDKQTTIIDGSLTDNCIEITENSVKIQNFTIRKGLIGVNSISSSGHNISNNIIRSNWEGIGLFQVTNAEITENLITDNFFEGINPIQSTDNIFSKNKINWNIYGIYLTRSNNNYIYENEIKGNTRGIETVDNSNNNKIYHNNFYSSEEDNAYDDFSNNWDDSYPSGGNYWDDYSGSDDDGDGIGDTAYNIAGDGNNKDNYPLMNPYYPQQPPQTPVITGPKSGVPGISYTYCISDTVDPEGDDVFVYWDWGNGISSGWLGPFASGEEICENHTWTQIGIYQIKAKLKDENGAESDWGTFFVTIPKTKSYFYNNYFENFFKIFHFFKYCKINSFLSIL